MEALIYIHKYNLIHLDLKPKNIMFKNEDLKEIVVIDFGISKIFKNETTKPIGLTRNYSAPEVFIES